MYRNGKMPVIVRIIVAVYLLSAVGCRGCATDGVFGRRTSTMLLVREVASFEQYGRVVRIERVRGRGAPEPLAEVGSKTEYPRAYLVSPNRRTLLIDFATKVKQLDLETKVVSDLVVRTFPDKNPFVGTVVFSPDGRKVFMWDQDDQVYQVTIYDTESKTSTVVARGGAEVGSAAPLLWRPDNTILMTTLGTDGPGPFRVYDLNAKRFVHSSAEKDVLSSTFSRSGRYASVLLESIDDWCQPEGFGDIGHVQIVDTATYREADLIGDGKAEIHDVLFSPDERQVLYSAAPTVNDIAPTPSRAAGDCGWVRREQERRAKFFLKPIGGAPVAADPAVVREQWDAPNHVELGGPDGRSVEFYGRVVWTPPPNGPDAVFIAEYYEDGEEGFLPRLERWIGGLAASR